MSQQPADREPNEGRMSGSEASPPQADRGRSKQEGSIKEPTAAGIPAPPFYGLLYGVVMLGCMAGMTWLARSGALQLWDRHPSPGEEYAFGWLFSLAFGMVGGFVIGSMIMASVLRWYWQRSGTRRS